MTDHTRRQSRDLADIMLRQADWLRERGEAALAAQLKERALEVGVHAVAVGKPF